MITLIYNDTQEAVPVPLDACLITAQNLAIAFLKEHWSLSPQGRRTLSRFNQIPLTWAFAERFFTLREETVGWTSTEYGKKVPDGSSDSEDSLVFICTRKQKHIGFWDAEDGCFYTARGNVEYLPEKVLAYMTIPVWED